VGLGYPKFLFNKPHDMPWVTYYIYLSRRRNIPVYMGDVPISNVMYSSELLEKLSHININQPYYIIFANNEKNPYLLVREPDDEITVLSTDYTNIERVIITQEDFQSYQSSHHWNDLN
jgi:hypothetical protein